MFAYVQFVTLMVFLHQLNVLKILIWLFSVKTQKISMLVLNMQKVLTEVKKVIDFLTK